MIGLSSRPETAAAEKGLNVGMVLTGVIVIVEVIAVLVAGAVPSRSVTCQLIVRLLLEAVGSLLVER